MLDELYGVKASHPGKYTYESWKEVAFEVSLRTNIVKAAAEFGKSGATFQGSPVITINNPRHWVQGKDGDYWLKQGGGTTPSAGVKELFSKGSDLRVDCTTATHIVHLKAIMVSLGNATFDKHFKHIRLLSSASRFSVPMYYYYWDYLDGTYMPKKGTGSAALPGDWGYVEHPEGSNYQGPPVWRRENLIRMADGRWWGFIPGDKKIKTSGEWERFMNAAREDGKETAQFGNSQT